MHGITQTIKYEAERDPEFAKSVKSKPGGEQLDNCIQCGTCSGVCPLSIYMDLTPRRIMNLTRSGFKEEVLSSNTIWLCSSCYACTVECPKEIKITDVMYSLKRKAIKDGYYPRHFPIPVLADEFFKMVKENGRASEGQLVTKMMLKTNWMSIFKNWKLGLRLLSRGRFSMKTERIKKPQDLATFLDASNGKGA